MGGRQSMRVGGSGLALLALVACVSSDHFEPKSSSSFWNLGGDFVTAYMDGSRLEGYTGSDVVQLGPYYTRTNFGCIDRDKGHWEYNGIVGVGIPPRKSPTVPLLYALSSKQRKWKKSLLPSGATEEMMQELEIENENVIPGFIYSLLLTKTGGELQLGGYVAASVLHKPIFAPVLPVYCVDGQCEFKHFEIHVQKLSMDGIELTRDARGTLDSGTSCLIIPKTAYEKFEASRKLNHRLNPLFTMRIAGHDFTFSAYNAGKLCVRTLENVPDHFLIGDVFFRQHVVVHDMRNQDSPAVGIASRDPDYTPIKVKPMVEDILLQVPEMTQTRQRKTSPEPDFELGPGLELEEGPLNVKNVVGGELDKVRSDAYTPPRVAYASSRKIKLESPTLKVDQNSKAPKEGAWSRVPESIYKGLPNFVERLPFYTTNGMQYAIEIGVGNPQQKKILVTLDTGSSQLAIFVVPNRTRSFWVLAGCFVLLMLGLGYSYYQVAATGPQIEGYESLSVSDSSPLTMASPSTWAKPSHPSRVSPSSPLYGGDSYQNPDTGL